MSWYVCNIPVESPKEIESLLGKVKLGILVNKEPSSEKPEFFFLSDFHICTCLFAVSIKRAPRSSQGFFPKKFLPVDPFSFSFPSSDTWIFWCPRSLERRDKVWISNFLCSTPDEPQRRSRRWSIGTHWDCGTTSRFELFLGWEYYWRPPYCSLKKSPLAITP